MNYWVVIGVWAAVAVNHALRCQLDARQEKRHAQRVSELKAREDALRALIFRHCSLMRDFLRFDARWPIVRGQRELNESDFILRELVNLHSSGDEGVEFCE